MISITNDCGLTRGKKYNIITEGVDGKAINEHWVCNDYGLYIQVDPYSFVTKEQFDIDTRNDKLNELL